MTLHLFVTILHHTKDEHVSTHIIREVHKTLRGAFNQAVRWGMIARNPVTYANVPKEEKGKREIWDEETLLRALDLCENEDLALVMNLAFACSLRMGELLGLTWDCVDISEEAVAKGSANIFVNKEQQRVSREAIEKIGDGQIIREFPAVIKSKTRSTVLVLKTPKTASGIRKVYLPESVVKMLIEQKKRQDGYFVMR